MFMGFSGTPLTIYTFYGTVLLMACIKGEKHTFKNALKDYVGGQWER